MDSTQTKILEATLKFAFYFVGWLGLAAHSLKKCPKLSWPEIKAWHKANFKTVLYSWLCYTGVYILWANAFPVIIELEARTGWGIFKWLLPLFRAKAGAASFFIGFFIDSLMLEAAKRAREKGVNLEIPPSPEPPTP